MGYGHIPIGFNIKNNRFGYRFRTRPNKAGQQCFEVQIVRLSDSDGFKVVMGYRYIDDIIAEQEKQKIQLENALANATLNSEIIDSILAYLSHGFDYRNIRRSFGRS